MRFFQWKIGPMDNFVYAFGADEGSLALVDPSFDVADVLSRAEAHGGRVTHVLATHGHFDHVDGIPEVKRRTGATVLAHSSAKHPHDHGLVDGERLQVAGVEVEVVHTPGHAEDAVCYVVGGTHLLTGDTLFVGDCGRVDLPGSDVDKLHASLLTTLAGLPETLVVCPGHDYGKTPTSTLAEEHRSNPTLKPRSLPDFRRFMSEP